MKPSWSVVLIAKNEAKTLPRLLLSLNEFQRRGGEVVLLDTGSDDNTPQVARDLGCTVTEVGEKFITVVSETLAHRVNKLFAQAGEGHVIADNDRLFSYADARNYAASLAVNDMVSMPDCDEEFTRLDLDAVEHCIAEGYEQLEFSFVFAHDAHGNEAIKFKQCKFYDRRKLRWQGIIHEVLVGEAKRTTLPEGVFKIEHWQNPSQNRKHYLPGLALDCYRNQDNDRNWHYLGRELTWTNRPKSAIYVLKQHIAMQRWPAERAQSMIFLGDCYGQLNKPDEQVDWYSRAFKLDPTRREALLRLAAFYRCNNKPEACAAYAAAALQIPWHPYYANHVAHYKHEPHELLYWARGWMGDIAGAQEHLLKAMEHLPFHPDYARDTKYYFPYADPGIEGWMRYDELKWLYETAQKMTTIAELGSWKGRSTHALATGCKYGQVTAIDHFLGSKGEEAVHAEAQTEAVYEQFLQNTKLLTNIVVNRNTTQQAAKEYDNGSFDMVFIDAEHTYEAVKADIKAWRPKARILLAGHDYCPQWPDVMRAVDEEVGMVETAGTIWYKLLHEPRVAIVVPTLGRPEKLNRLLHLIKENAGYSSYTVMVKPDCMEEPRGVPRLLHEAVCETDAPLIMYLGNDCLPEKGFLQIAVFAMLRHFPKLDGLIGLNDGYWHGEVATHWLAGRALLPNLGGEFFHTGYHHVGCDNELTERAKALGRYWWERRAVVKHEHPVVSGKPPDTVDEVYKIGWQHRKQDEELLAERSQQLGFAFRMGFERPRIPRRIFSIWLSDNGVPKCVVDCLQSQRLTEWEHRLITLDNCYRNAYIDRCIEKKQWVRAADYLRLYYLYEQGGVYLDADMAVVKLFPDEMLTHRLFVGKEENGYISNAAIGAEPQHPVLRQCLSRMDVEFFDSDLTFEAGMQVFTEEVYKALGSEHGIHVYDPDYFFPYNHQTGDTKHTENTVLHHHFMRSWEAISA